MPTSWRRHWGERWGGEEIGGRKREQERDRRKVKEGRESRRWEYDRRGREGTGVPPDSAPIDRPVELNIDDIQGWTAR